MTLSKLLQEALAYFNAEITLKSGYSGNAPCPDLIAERITRLSDSIDDRRRKAIDGIVLIEPDVLVDVLNLRPDLRRRLAEAVRQSGQRNPRGFDGEMYHLTPLEYGAALARARSDGEQAASDLADAARKVVRSYGPLQDPAISQDPVDALAVAVANYDLDHGAQT